MLPCAPQIPLNARQLEVLDWIGEGCPDGIMTGHSHKVTARALQARRLVKISKGKHEWSASLTDAGRYYLDHGTFPPSNQMKAPKPAKARQSDTSGAASSVSGTAPRVETPAPDDQPQSTDQSTKSADESGTRATSTLPRRRSPAAQLVAEVVEAGGVLEVAERSGRDTYRMGQLVTTANRHGMTPPGTRLVHNIVHDGPGWYGNVRHVFALEEGPAGTDTPLQPVPVPKEVRRFHPAVVALRKSGHLEVSPAARNRAMRILHAIATEAEHRDFAITTYQPKPTSGYNRESTSWHLLCTLGPDTVPLMITEESDRVDHTPTARELAENRRHPWTQIPTHDSVPSGRLRVDIGSHRSDRKSFWADRASWTLEDKLPELLRELAIRADELRLLREAKAKAEQAYRRAVELEEQRARVRASEAHRQAILDKQLERWRAARELRDHAAAVAAVIEAATVNGGADNETIDDARRWLSWIKDKADRQDPTRTLPAWPKDPELPPYELEKFMNRVAEPVEMRYQPRSY